MEKTEFTWKTEGFGASHRGRPGGVLADGSEPESAVFDTGSGSCFHETSDWWVYDGETARIPRATALRGACSCGWRGTTLHPIDWPQVIAEGPDVYDTQGPHDDWQQHLGEVEARTIPIPQDVAALLEQLRERLDVLTYEAPLAALRLVAVLEHATAEAGEAAAHAARVDDQTWGEIATGLGLTESEARSRLLRYARRY